jgi:sporulation protein YlmC with PRC-barrel domain
LFKKNTNQLNKINKIITGVNRMKSFNFLCKALLSAVTALFIFQGAAAQAGELVYARVYGKVIDSMGQFVKNAEIIIGDTDRKEIFRNKGKYITLKVGVKKGRTNRFGDYDVKNVVIGYQPITVKVNNVERIKDMIVINRGTNELNFTLPHADKVSSNIFKSSVTGKVFDERTRLPLKDVEIEINKKRIVSNSEGNFHFDWVQPGYHFIYAFKDDYKDFVERINVQKNDNYYEIFITPERKHVIISSKIVEDNTDRPLSEVMVEVNSKKVFTGANGVFQVMVEKNRHHVLTVSIPGYKEYSTYIYADKDKKIDTIKMQLLRSERVYQHDSGIKPEYSPAEKRPAAMISDPRSLLRGSSSGSAAYPAARPSTIFDNGQNRDYPDADRGNDVYNGRGKVRGRDNNRGSCSNNEEVLFENRSYAVNNTAVPSLKGGTGLLFLPDTRTQQKGRSRLAARYTRFDSDNNAEEELYNTAITYGAAEGLEVGISNHQVEAHNKKVNTLEDTETFLNLKYRGWTGKHGQAFVVGTDFSGDLLRPYVTYGFSLGKKGDKGDMNLTVRKNIENNVSATDYGLGCRLKIGRDFDFILEGIRESFNDSNMYNLGLRYSNEENLSLDLYTSWLFDLDNARGIGGGMTWGF